MAQAMHRGLESTIGSLRSLFGIIMGVTIAGAIARFITGAGEDPIDGSNLFEPPTVLALLFFFAVVQFFHGNHRILDEVSMPSGRKPDVADPRRLSRYADLWFEYFFMLVQSAMFAAASFYLYDASSFILIMTTILALDLLLFARKIAWLISGMKHAVHDLARSPHAVTMAKRSRTTSEQEASAAVQDAFRSLDWIRERNKWGHDTRWFLLNAGAVGLLAIPLLLGGSAAIGGYGWPFWFAVGVLAVRGIVDYGVNWRHYFPSGPTKMRVFFAAPFTAYQSGEGTQVDGTLRATLQPIIQVLRSRGHEVFSAHELEGWGEDVLPAREIAERDFQSLIDHDVLLALVTDRPSRGVAIELGWAFGLGKPVLVLASAGRELDQRILNHATGVLKYRSMETIPGLFNEIEEALCYTVERGGLYPPATPVLSAPDTPDVYIHSAHSFRELDQVLARSPFSTFAVRRLRREGARPWAEYSLSVIEQSELVIIDLSDEPDGHAEIDLGYALAKQKPVIALCPYGHAISPLIRGLDVLYRQARNPISGDNPHFHVVAYETDVEKLYGLESALQHFSHISEELGVQV
jgi:nucleoside 2-deoxyribosyltransferase